MPFSTMDQIESRDKYVTQLKKELSGLTDNQLGEFHFFDGVTIGSDEQSFLLVGDVKSAVTKGLKDKAKARATGTCYIEGKTLNITLGNGKMPEAKLKAIFKEAKGFSYRLVEANLAKLDREDEVRGIVRSLNASFDEVKGAIGDDNRKSLRILFGQIDDAINASKWDDALKVADKLRKDMATFAKEVNPKHVDNDPKEEVAVRGIVNALMSTFDKVKGAIGDDNRKALRIQIGQIDDALQARQWAQVRKLAATLEADMRKFAREVDPRHGELDPRDKANATQRWKDTMARFDKAKARLTDDERKAIRVLWGTAESRLKAGDWAGTIQALEAVDKEVIKAVKAALKDAESDATTQQGKIDTGLSPAAQLLVTKLSQQAVQLENLRQALLAEMKQVNQIRVELREEQAKETPDAARLVDIKKRLDAKKLSLDGAQKSLETQRKEMDKTEGELKAQNLLNNRDAVERLERAKKAAEALESLLDSTPINQAREELKATATKMAEATQWREERLKQEAAGGAHATSRHGAHTGLERQARRAATAESVTPDQVDNPSGSAQVLEWNKVKFSYTTVDGKRVIKDRLKVATELVGTTTAGALPTETGSMWATPVLEKEAYELALSHANKLSAFKQFKRSVNPKNAGGTWDDFLSATFVVKKSPGWGYAVQHSGADVSIPDAEAVLRDFENGKIDLDQMFKRLNTTLYAVDGGAKLIPYAVVVLRRDTTASPWTLFTQYPDNTKTGVKWEPMKGWGKPDVELRKTPGGPITSYSASALP